MKSTSVSTTAPREREVPSLLARVKETPKKRPALNNTARPGSTDRVDDAAIEKTTGLICRKARGRATRRSPVAVLSSSRSNESPSSGETNRIGFYDRDLGLFWPSRRDYARVPPLLGGSWKEKK